MKIRNQGRYGWCTWWYIGTIYRSTSFQTIFTNAIFMRITATKATWPLKKYGYGLEYMTWTWLVSEQLNVRPHKTFKLKTSNKLMFKVWSHMTCNNRTRLDICELLGVTFFKYTFWIAPSYPSHNIVRELIWCYMIYGKPAFLFFTI